MTTDLIKRLRMVDDPLRFGLDQEAADEMERLTAENADLLSAVEAGRQMLALVTAERDAFKQTMHDEIAENLRLREIGGALDSEAMPTFLERVFAENDALRAAQGCGCQPGTCESKPTGCRMAEEVKPGSGAQ